MMLANFSGSKVHGVGHRTASNWLSSDADGSSQFISYVRMQADCPHHLQRWESIPEPIFPRWTIALFTSYRGGMRI